MGKTLQQIQGELISEFDFIAVHKTMTALDWTWHSSGEVPTVGKMVTTVLGLIEHLYENKDYCKTATGGFVVECNDGYWTLAFRVDEAEVVESENIEENNNGN